MSRDENHCHKSTVCFLEQSVLNSDTVREGRARLPCPGSCHRAVPKARRRVWQISRPAAWRRGRVGALTRSVVGPAIAAASSGASPGRGRREGQRGRRGGYRGSGSGDDSETDREPRGQKCPAYYAEIAGVADSPTHNGAHGLERPQRDNDDQDAATGPVSLLSRPRSRTTARPVTRHQSGYTKRSP